MQVNLEYLQLDSRSFVTGEDRALSLLFGASSDESVEARVTVKRIAQRLATLFATLKVSARTVHPIMPLRTYISYKLCCVTWRLHRIFRAQLRYTGSHRQGCCRRDAGLPAILLRADVAMPRGLLPPFRARGCEPFSQFM